jgi:hypothetical protein
MNLGIGNEAAQFHFWEYVFEFSVLCLYSAVQFPEANKNCLTSDLQCQGSNPDWKSDLGPAFVTGFWS